MCLVGLEEQSAIAYGKNGHGKITKTLNINKTDTAFMAIFCCRYSCV